MRLVKVGTCPAGEYLGKTIYDEFGRPLLLEGTLLTDSLLNALKTRNINLITVMDTRLSDLVLEDTIPLETRVHATMKIKESFDQIRSDTSKMGHIIEDNLGDFKNMVGEVFTTLGNNGNALNLLSSLTVMDDSVYTHSFNVMTYSVQLALGLGFPPDNVKELGLGALLHDVGKLFIPKEIYLKPGKLDENEFEIMKTHTEIGFSVLKDIYGIPLVAAHCAYQHHERLDGSGYPRGLTAGDIHPYAKVLGVADAFDAMVSPRVYRSALLPHDGLEVLYAGYGTLFDRKVVDVFKKKVAIYPVGLTVNLSNGETGVVEGYNQDLPSKPIVRIIKDKFDLDVKEERKIDLSEVLDVVIVGSDLLM